MRVLLIAAENGAIAGAKVGGMADVIRDLPPALLAQHVVADVIMPSYGELAQRSGASWQRSLLVPFSGRLEKVELWRLASPQQEQQTLMLSHPLFTQIYHSDDRRPFATDASKFALFSAAVCQYLCDPASPLPDVLHLHDWHSCFVALLRQSLPRYQALQQCRMVLTIHNIAVQGTRPLNQDSSSLQAWYPEMMASMTPELLAQICDRHAPNCINPLRAGINLADKVHVVSPSYADEVRLPSQPQLGFFGGEGLEQDLQRRGDDVVGILNGCDYQQRREACSYPELLQRAADGICRWMGQQALVRSVDQIALTRLQQWQQQPRPELLLTSVGRLTDQKVLLLRQTLANGETVLATLLAQLQHSACDARLLLLGSGDPVIAAEFRQCAAQYRNFLFIDGYDETLSQSVFEHGDAFLMPSSFEPCGISQLLAMRAGQVCVAHQVGGLKDTVFPGINGYGFAGADLAEQSQQLLQACQQLLKEFGSEHWGQLQQAASDARYDWSSQVSCYLSQLYRG
ncbi:glycogen/starch synthase [uncultured Ferrimonas sp.]|uniref:glycogen synthase n=1 Tax=uncultured Ferrimonas sp. TaxID=432640 RepID=UPI00261FECC1|nr:glycogen/starch synthase [uncultured Ferrimonas sp.]